MNIKNILVPTDFSPEANNALNVAITIAKKINASISLLHVIDVPTINHYDSLSVFGAGDVGMEDPEVYVHYTKKLSEVVETKVNKIIAENPGVTIDKHIEFDSLQRHLADFVVKDNTDLIVIGSQGISGIDEVLVGSNTEKIIRLAKVPVLTVKREEKDFAPKNIVFASDFNKVSQHAISSIQLFQELFDSKIHLVKVITPNNFEATPFSIQHLKDFAKTHEFKNYDVATFNDFSEEEGIRGFAEFINADMISLTTHGRTGIQHLLLGSIAEEVANHAIRPVLTFNKKLKE
ncbi:universal stress protein [Flammeovirga kamogawensis]|uniref:Universal stress protein n=1 Tax=Flammeovirga kamogawensis TaxID=373891 RepID=A0ABX8GX89_9BACT|nr:universal stress protein [Flammeovirga kamogawensis]MBB6460654.1 nucleotide-binding universal stress UspA family protein [Flammeovirga kamogawensis]QWG08009.1 universal stress protein [Flammeovirga kamogawensis]TRX69816.1 universal stress protein [Flammeovirga kamogawensis]